MQPEMLIVGGPNGCGKTTFAMRCIAKNGFPYLGADAIAYRLSPHDVASASVAAGEIFLQELRRHVADQHSFVVETTLSGLTFRRTMEEARQLGFRLTVAYYNLESADHCVARVAERVRKGGHHVPEADIRRRYQRSLENFWAIYRKIAHTWIVLYNEDTQPRELARGGGDRITILDPVRFGQFLHSVERGDRHG